MTSRNPESFDRISQQVTEARAHDFHERWVVGYGHASVAEHAVIHIAIENYSRIAIDRLEDNRLGSYTEKSSRYQPMRRGDYHVPRELTPHHELTALFRDTADGLMNAYESVTARCVDHLKRETGQQGGETGTAYGNRLRRQAMDASRGLLPSAITTNVGLTANARVLEKMISKLLSAPLREEQELGQRLKGQVLKVAPTLVKYAERSEYLAHDLNRPVQLTIPDHPANNDNPSGASVVRDDPEAEIRLAAAYIFHRHNRSYQESLASAAALTESERAELLASYLSRMEPHDPGPRELEQITFTLELLMDYGALREFRRHRIQSLLPQNPTVALGRNLPQLVKDAGAQEMFDEALDQAGKAHCRINSFSPQAARYLVTHSHIQRLITQLNLRECYHLFRLRTSPRRTRRCASRSRGPATSCAGCTRPSSPKNVPQDSPPPAATLKKRRRSRAKHARHSAQYKQALPRQIAGQERPCPRGPSAAR